MYADPKGLSGSAHRAADCIINCTDGVMLENYTSGGNLGKRLTKPYARDIILYNNNIYMIASGGINMLNINTNTITHLSHGSNFPGNNISNIIKDRLDKIWLTSLSGLGCIDMKSI